MRAAKIDIRELGALTHTLLDLYPFAKEALSNDRRAQYLDVVDALQDALEAALDPTFVRERRCGCGETWRAEECLDAVCLADARNG